ncbi:MAG: hypothetical protein WC401_12405 [Bacteroidales bacterium]|jgi:hypothetical protein
MKFNEAFDKAWAIEKSKNPEFKGIKEDYVRAAALAWNCVAVAQNVLDDTVFINKNNFPISVSLPEKNKKVKEKNVKEKEVPPEPE